MKKLLSAFYSLQPIEQKALFSLCVLSLLQVSALYVYDHNLKNQKIPLSFWYLNDSIKVLEHKEFMMHSFNSNLVDSMFWDSVGLPIDAIQAIKIAKDTGLVFTSSYDLLAIPEFPFSIYKKVKHYVEIDHDNASKPGPVYVSNTKSNQGQSKRININTADSVELLSLKGIGSGRARLIIKYRTLLGGFVDIFQLLEVFNMPDSIFRQFQHDIYLGKNDNITPIQINIVEETRLWAHPYIRMYAKQISRFRQSGRKLNSMDDFITICSPPPDSLHTYRLEKYLDFKF